MPGILFNIYLFLQIKEHGQSLLTKNGISWVFRKSLPISFRSEAIHYSYLNARIGLALAVLNDCQETVIKAIKSVSTAVRRNISNPKSIL